MQVFTKQANRWAERECSAEEVAAWREALRQTDVRVTVSHDSYLINVASPDPQLRRRSLESYVREMQRCIALDIDYLCSHPGNCIEEREPGVERNAEAITQMLERAPGRTMLLLETTAGAGTALGSTFEELARIIELVPEPHRSRLGVCADTCHLYSAGYDLVRDYDGVWSHFGDALGLDRLRLVHLNDSKAPFGSHRDRHELIGEGTLGHEPFRRIMNDPCLALVPKVIETPKGDDHTASDSSMLARLRGYLER
jgi:deoxyribonuclease IV